MLDCPLPPRSRPREPHRSPSAASELDHVGLTEALELCLLIRGKAPERYSRAALRWHGRLCREVNVSLEEAQAVLVALVLLAGEREQNAAYALAEPLSRCGDWIVVARHLLRGRERRGNAACGRAG